MQAIATTHAYAHVHLFARDEAEAAAVRSLLAALGAERPADVDVVSGSL